MLRAAVSVLACGASAACGFAAVGLALYGNGPAAAAAGALFGGFGLVGGLLCGVLHAVFAGVPAAAGRALPASDLARLVRATLASAAAERQARPGSAADRRPAPVAPPASRAEPARFASSAFGT